MGDQEGKPPGGGYNPVPIIIGVAIVLGIVVAVMWNQGKAKDKAATNKCMGSSSADECSGCCGEFNDWYTWSDMDQLHCTCVRR